MAKRSLPDEMKSKTDIVKEIIAKGTKSPTGISKIAKAEYGVEITSNYVSMIKGGIKKKRRKNKKLVVRGKRVVRTAASRAPASGDISLENLALRFALKAGSVGAALAALEKLK